MGNREAHTCFPHVQRDVHRPAKRAPLAERDRPGFSPAFPSLLVGCEELRLPFDGIPTSPFVCTALFRSHPLFLPPSCRSARARQGRSLPPLRYVQLRTSRWPSGQPVTGALIPFGLPAGIEAAIGAGSVPKGPIMSSADRSAHIRELNDTFRTSLEGGKCLFTAGVSDLGVAFATAALAFVRSFSTFTPDNDPYGEHDFGSFEIGEQRLFWKIDYYDLTLCYGSNDPADVAQTRRVLTIMLAEEY
jgi:hypothetical protein